MSLYELWFLSHIKHNALRPHLGYYKSKRDFRTKLLTKARATNLLWEINGTEGDIQVTGPLGHGQLVPLTIRGARGDERELTPLVPPAALYDGLPENPVIGNVAQVYKLLAADVRHSTRTAPSFADAVVLH